MSASFNAIDMGPAVQVVTMPAPNELQVNAYPGVNGLEVINHGSRGGTSHAEGWCYGADLTSLAAAEQTWRGMVTAGTVATLVDTLGTSWANVRITLFQPQGRVLPAVFLGTGGFVRRYRMEFLHRV